MVILGWRELFDLENLTSALDYVGRDDIAIFSNDKDHIHAKVHGRKEHVVDIHVVDKSISTMHCDCNYGKSGGHCSHMAAVLYALENRDSKENVNLHPFDYPEYRDWFDDEEISEEDEERLLDLIEELSEAELKTAIYHIAKKSKIVRKNLVVRYARCVDHDIAYSVRRMIEELDESYKNPSYSNSFVYDEKGYVAHVRAIMDRYVPRLIKAGLLKDSIDITIDALQTVGWNFLSNEGVKNQFASFITSYLEKLFSEADSDISDYMLAKLKEIEYDAGNDLFVLRTAFDFRNSCSIDEKYIKTMMEERKEFLESDNEENYEEWYWDYFYDRCSLFVIDKLLNGYGSKDDVDQFICNHFKSKSADERVLGYYRAYGCLKEEVELLLLILSGDNLSMDQNEIFTDVELSELESRAYVLLNDLGEFEKAADFLLNEITEQHRYYLLRNSRDLEKYLAPEKWREFKSCMYASIGNSKTTLDSKILIFKFMTEEENADVVFKTLNRCALSNDFVDSVIGKLVAMDPERAFLIHSRCLSKSMKKAKGRDKYRTLVKKLSEMESMYPDGRKFAEKLVSSWKESFPDKVSMLEEIRKVGV